MKKMMAVAALPLLALAACGGSTTTVTKTVTQTVTASPATPAAAASDSSAVASDTSATGDDGAVGPSDSSDSSATDEATETGSGAPLAFGDTYTSGTTGRKVTLSALSPYTPSSSAALDEEKPAGAVYRKFKITLDNSSKETFNSGDILLTVTAGERTVSTIVDGDVGNSPYVSVLPGRKLSWTVAYAAKPGEHLTVEVSTLGGTVATWDGVAK